MTSAPYVVVIGGANVDLKARGDAPLIEATSNPGTVLTSPGGVGRNVAEVLARLGTATHLVAAVGRDAFGDLVLERTAAAGVDVSGVRRVEGPTDTYAAVLDADGELFVAVSAMPAVDGLGPDQVAAQAALIRGAAYVVLDANLSAETLRAALETTSRAGVPAALEPVSVRKADRVAAVLDPALPVHTLTPNLAELAALTGRPCDHLEEIIAAARALQDRGVACCWVRLGHQGSLVVAQDAHPLPAVHSAVVDVSGAGDAMLGAYVHAFLRGEAPADAAAFAHAAAALTIAVPETVRPDLTHDLVTRTRAATGTRRA